jgi:hypothetical protein
MQHLVRRLLALSAVLLALLAIAACAQPPHGGSAPQIRDDTRDYDHPDRGMRDSHQM